MAHHCGRNAHAEYRHHPRAQTRPRARPGDRGRDRGGVVTTVLLHGAWQGDRFLIRRAGVEGEIGVTGTEVRVRARLGLMYGVLKGTVEDEIRRQLDRHFT
ncbi:MAG: hypothetical protein C4338_02085 [Rhodanobacteraceae bacterium]